ncbi:RelA/SpoT family protein, partial [Magnetococcales bacterium HHB-1]
RALGMVHGEFKPIPGRFKDYIALPKSNGYQSLHTVVFGPFGNRIEIQIRTERMHRIAESGVAAHWVYKEGGKKKGKPKKNDSEMVGYAWLKELLEAYREVDDPGQFLDNVKIDLFPDEIYLFTPLGKIITLPRGATPVDFAYAVHSKIGDHCAGCRVNSRMVPLKTPLSTGDTVEIITRKNVHPNQNWLQFVVTGKARHRISRWLREEQRDQLVQLGKELLLREVKKAAVGVLSEKKLSEALEIFKIENLEEFYFRIGSSKLSPIVVYHRLFPEAGLKGKPKDKSRSLQRLQKEGKRDGSASFGLRFSQTLSDMLVKAARCCTPVPGDDVVGIITTGRGITLHCKGCPNLAAFSDQPGRHIDGIDWEEMAGDLYLARVRCLVQNRKNVFNQINNAVVEAKSRITALHVQDRSRNPCIYLMDLEVTGLEQLNRVIHRIQTLPVTHGVVRVRG